MKGKCFEDLNTKERVKAFARVVGKTPVAQFLPTGTTE